MTTAATKQGGDSRPPEVGWVGSIGHTPLAEVFRRIAAEERSGDLQVTISSAIKTVYFDRGFVVFASSNLKSDRLGESMIESGRISRQGFAVASRLMKHGKLKFGQALVQAGIVSEEELGRNVAAQVNRIVLSLFSVKQGMYSFDERPCIIPLELMVSLSVHRILIEGIRRMTSKRLILAALPPLDTQVRVSETPPFTLDAAKLRPAERAVLRSVGKGASLQAIAKTIGGNDGVVLRACYGLFAAGVLDADSPRAGSLLRRVQEETGTFLLSEIRRKVAKRPYEASLPPTTAEHDLFLQPTQEPELPPTPKESEVSRWQDEGLPEMEMELTPEPRKEALSTVGDSFSARMRPSKKTIPSSYGVEEAGPAPVVSDDKRQTTARWEEPPAAIGMGWSWSRFFSTVLAFFRWFLSRDTEEPDLKEPSEQALPPAKVPGPTPAAPRLTEKLEPAFPSRVDGNTLEDRQVVKEPAFLRTRGDWEDSESPQALVGEENITTKMLGVPSWSIKDDPSRAIKTPGQADDEADLESRRKALPIQRVGIPSWSIKDDPRDRVKHHKPTQEEANEEPLVETVGVPSWSILDGSIEAGEESFSDGMETWEEPEPREPESLEELELERDEPPSPPSPPTPPRLPPPPEVESTALLLSSMDTDLFVETDDDEGSSMLNPIDIEEIKLEEETHEFEFEIDDAILTGLPDSVEELSSVPADEAEPELAETDREPSRAELELVVKEEEPADVEALLEDRPEAAQMEAHPVLSPPVLKSPLESDAPPPPDTAGEGFDLAVTDPGVRALRIKQGGGEARLVRDVKLHFQFRDWDGAVRLLEQLIAIKPGSALYRGMLARALSRHPTLSNNAERHFVEALRLSPQDPELHYWLGIYYKRFGLKSRAYNEFRTTLRIDPNHQGARKQLVGEKREGGVFKKLFG